MLRMIISYFWKVFHPQVKINVKLLTDSEIFFEIPKINIVMFF